jgi:hypothetical protein
MRALQKQIEGMKPKPGGAAAPAPQP